MKVEQIRYPTVPQQPNDKDCVLYAMKYFEKFLDFTNTDLQWSSWNPSYSHQDILCLRKKVKHVITDEISVKCNAPINVLPQQGEGEHTRVIDIEALPVTEAADSLLTRGSPQGRAY